MKKHSAFSLIELSIVILIIGILIAGITQSSRLVKQARLKTARTLTQSSPVAGIADLLLWYETSLASSFDDSAQSDGEAITNWYDNNPQNTAKNNAVQSTSTNQPIFKENIFYSGAPSVQFDGTNSFINSATRFNAINNFTVFVVANTETTHEIDTESTSAMVGTSGQRYIIYPTLETSSGTAGAGMSIGTNGISIYEHSGGYMPAIAVYEGAIGSNTNVISWVCSDRQHSIYLNGTLVKTGLQSTKSYVYAPYRLGGDSSTYGRFSGNLGEFIVFARVLKTEERQAIEDYLSKKYGITAS